MADAEIALGDAVLLRAEDDEDEEDAAEEGPAELPLGLVQAMWQTSDGERGAGWVVRGLVRCAVGGRSACMAPVPSTPTVQQQRRHLGARALIALVTQPALTCPSPALHMHPPT